jgi:hypothetical protein
MSKARDKSNVETFVAVNEIEQKEQLLEYDKSLNIQVCGDLLGVCRPLYELSKDLKGNLSDIVLVVCDDVNCVNFWDDYVFNLFENFNGSIFLNDGLQDPNNTIQPAITMPLMTFECLLAINRYIFHPAYRHYFADNELYLNLKELNLLKDIRTTSQVFQHEHYEINKRPMDVVDQKIITQCGNMDRQLFQERMKLSIKERLL